MKSKNIVLSGLFIALGVLLPMVFHQFNMTGPMFLPMHIPVLMAGLFLGGKEGLLVGIITPILSSVLTGMPVAFPMLPIMIFELGTYGLVSGTLAKKFRLNLYISMVSSMLAGRVSATIAVFVLATFFTYKGLPAIAYIKTAIITGLPGILVQLIFVPMVVILLKRNIEV